MTTYTRYICVDNAGNPTGIGDGYPWVPKWNGEPAFGQVIMYWTSEAAQNYANVFRNSSEEQFKLEVKRITITIEE